MLVNFNYSMKKSMEKKKIKKKKLYNILSLS